MPDSKIGRNGSGQWLPGTSGNPGGNPRQAGFAAAVREATNDGADLRAFAISFYKGEIKDEVFNADGAIVRITPKAKERFEAVKWLRDSGWGRLPAVVDPETSPFDGQSERDVLAQVLDSLPAEDKRFAMERLARQLPGAVQ